MKVRLHKIDETPVEDLFAAILTAELRKINPRIRPKGRGGKKGLKPLKDINREKLLRRPERRRMCA